MSKRTSPTLTAYLVEYLSEREVSPSYALALDITIEKLNRFAGRVLRVRDLNCTLVNKWIVYMLESGLSPYSAKGYRGNILSLWNQAYMDRLNDEPPLRVRKVKRPRLLVDAYNHDEIRQLLAGAAKLSGYDDNGNQRAIFWQALIHAAYSTGLRRGDVLAIEKAKVAADGLYTCVQHKTGFPLTVRLSADAMRFAAMLQSPMGILLISWPYRLDAFTTAFGRVRNHAGVKRGSFRYLRRAAGSYAEAAQYGAGARLLGHRDPGVFKRHYEDNAITGTKPVEPPTIPPLDKEAS